MNRKFTYVAMSVMLLIATTNLRAQAENGGGNPNPGIIPSNARPNGKTYGEWGAAWWQWALSVPADRNPLTDETGEFCDEGQGGPVWLLAGTFGNSAERVCTVPTGKKILVPVFNWIFGAGAFDCEPSLPGVPCDIPALRQLAAENTEAAVVLDVTIDGVPVENVADYRAITPEPFSLNYPDNSVVGLPAGTYSPNVSDGYWLMLTPLSKGVHTIEVRVIAPGTIFGLIEYEVITHLIVE